MPPERDNALTSSNDAEMAGETTTSSRVEEPFLSCTEQLGNRVDAAIVGFFRVFGNCVGKQPKVTIFACITLTALCAIGFVNFTLESRVYKLWVPQDTPADFEEMRHDELFPQPSRFSQLLVTSPRNNLLTKGALSEVLQLHDSIKKLSALYNRTLVDVCTTGAGYTCSTIGLQEGICSCFIQSIFRVWDYDLEKLRNDSAISESIQSYGGQADLESVLGTILWGENNTVESAQALSVTYSIESNSSFVDGRDVDLVGESWEQAFLDYLQSYESDTFDIQYFSSRSFDDEFGDSVSSDLILVQVAYFLAFLFLGASLGNVRPGPGSRWTLSMSSLVLVALSTIAGFGVASAFGLFYGPVHNLIPFVLLGIGVDDSFVITNAFNRELNVPRKEEDNASLFERSKRALSRAGASITVTSLTDLVAFAISSSSALPALASFCAYCSISIFFLWLFSAAFFTACIILDERRQRDNRRELLVCVKRKVDPDAEVALTEGIISRYFRKYHAPALLSKPGKMMVLTVCAGLLSFGIYGAVNLAVEDSTRKFIPESSYVNDWFESRDDYFPAAGSLGSELFVIFEDEDEIYRYRNEIASLDTRVEGLDTEAPYIASPTSEATYGNVMASFWDFLQTYGTFLVGGTTLERDGWPNRLDFVATIDQFAVLTGAFEHDLSISNTTLNALRVRLQYIKLTKNHGGRVVGDAGKQIDAMDTTRNLVQSWGDLPPRFVYSQNFLLVEGFKIIRQELFLNVGLAIVAVGIIVFLTVASPVTSLLITLNIGACIVEILGFMHAWGLVIDSISVINIVMAVGLSVDYSAHVGHCFMVKGGTCKDQRATEALADIGAAVLQGATSTFLAVSVLLFSSSYVFATLSRQFALTAVLGVLHGLVVLPVLLSIMGPKPFSSAEIPVDQPGVGQKVETFDNIATRIKHLRPERAQI